MELTNFPSFEGNIPNAQRLELPTTFNQTAPGSVRAMEWSSDGYVLAVGWENGWAVWSVGGRCLASGFGVEDEIDSDR